MTSSVLDPANQDPSKEMQESYERERQPEFDQAVQDAQGLQGREKVDALSDAAKKRKLGERMFDSIESGVTGSVQWLQKQAEDDPNRYTDDVLRIFGGGIKNTAWLVSKVPLLDKLAEGEDWLAEQARGLSAKLTPDLDPRFAGWGTRIATGLIADKGIRKATGAVTKGVRAYKAVSKADEIMALAKKRDLGLQMMAKLDPNFEQLDLFPDPLSKITPGQGGWPNIHRGLPVTGENLAQIAAKGIDEATLRSLKAAGVSEGMRFLMKNWNVTGKLLDKSASRAAGAAVERAFTTNEFFRLARLKLLDEFEKGFLNVQTTLKPKLHHIAGIKASLPLYDNIRISNKAKSAYGQLNELLKSKGVFPGHHMKNFLMLSDESHLAIHRFMDDVIGPSGEVFFNAERRKLISKSTAGRLKVAEEYADLVNRSKELALDIAEQYKKLYGVAPDDPDIIVRIMTEAEDLYQKIGPRYSNESLRKIIEQVEGFYQKELLDKKWKYQMWKANQENIKLTGKPLPGMVTPEVDKIFDPPKNWKKRFKPKN